MPAVDLVWILAAGLAMSAIALAGGFVALLPTRILDRFSLPAVAFAAGSLVGGALFHLLPESVDRLGNGLLTWITFAGGFVAFLLLEAVLHWHHCRGAAPDDRDIPLRWLILAADGLHNLIGGLAIGAVFVVDFDLGAAAWLAAALHELPQEIGDFGVLLFTGLSIRRALVFNLLSALTFPVGMLIAWTAAGAVDVGWLVPFGAGNFVYIAAADLIPEVTRRSGAGSRVLHLSCFAAGLGLLLALRVALDGVSS